MAYTHSTYGTARLAFDLDGIPFIARRNEKGKIAMYTRDPITIEQRDRALKIVEEALGEMDKALKNSMEVTKSNTEEIARFHRNINTRKQKRK